jgi:hypothetical protein
MEGNKPIEQKVAETVLQQTEVITIGEHNFTIAPPSIATLILASSAVSHLPHLQLSNDRVLEDTLSCAKDCTALGELAAVLVLGAKQALQEVTEEDVIVKRRFFGLIKAKRKVRTALLRRDQLAKQLLEDLTPRELNSLVGQILSKMQISDFFGLTTFLTEINLTRPTKVETEPTASGQ